MVGGSVSGEAVSELVVKGSELVLEESGLVMEEATDLEGELVSVLVWGSALGSVLVDVSCPFCVFGLSCPSRQVAPS